MKKLFFMTLLLLIGVLAYMNNPGYAFTFLDERTKSVGKDTVEYTMEMANPVVNGNLKYENDKFKIHFAIRFHGIDMIIYNKTGNAIKLDYGLWAFNYTNNKSYKVYNYVGTDAGNKNAPPFTIVAPGSTYKGGVTTEINKFNIRKPQNLYNTLIFPTTEYVANVENPEPPLSYKGKSFSLSMPLTINGVKEDYTFTFKITDVKIIKYEKQWKKEGGWSKSKKAK
ncbi:MAG: hypothetical protein PHH44_01765 [bacterium]|nr:hypothetical protein [bacterium]